MHRYLFLTSLFVVGCSAGGGDTAESESSGTSPGTTAELTSGTTADTTPDTGTTGEPTTESTPTTSATETGPGTTVETTTGSTGSTGTTETGDTDESSGDTTAGETTGAVEESVLQNTPEPCEAESFVYPLLPGEAGHLAAATLTPAVYPFAVTAIRYELGGDGELDQCLSTLAHLVEVHVSGAAKPEAMPSVNAASFASIEVAADDAATDGRAVELAIDPPITLVDGEHLVVAVQLAASEDLASSICLRSCNTMEPTPAIDWWSNAAQEPYDWSDMVVDFGFQSNFTVSALGTGG